MTSLVIRPVPWSAVGSQLTVYSFSKLLVALRQVAGPIAVDPFMRFLAEDPWVRTKNSQACLLQKGSNEIFDIYHQITDKLYEDTDVSNPLGIIGGEQFSAVGAIQKFSDRYVDLSVLSLEIAPYRDNCLLHQLLAADIKKLTIVATEQPNYAQKAAFNKIIAGDLIEAFTRSHIDWMLLNDGWSTLAYDIAASLSSRVWISVDIDILHFISPQGFMRILSEIISQGKTIVGFDLYGVLGPTVPLGSKMLYALGSQLLLSQGLIPTPEYVEKEGSLFPSGLLPKQKSSRLDSS